MVGNEIDEVINEFFESLLTKYQLGLEEAKKVIDFVLDSVDGMNFKLNTISLNRDGSYIDSPDWVEKKEGTINPKTMIFVLNML